MDPKLGWYQPEQCGPAKDLWERIWENQKPHQMAPAPAPTNGEPGIGQPPDSTMPGTYTRKEGSNGGIGPQPNRARAYGINSANQIKLAHNEGCPWLVPGKTYSRGVVGLVLI